MQTIIPLTQNLEFKYGPEAVNLIPSAQISYIKNGEVYPDASGQEALVQKRRGWDLYAKDGVNFVNGYGLHIWQEASGINTVMFVGYNQTATQYQIGRVSAGTLLSVGALTAPPFGTIAWCETRDPYVVCNTTAGISQSCYYVSKSGAVYSATQLTNATHGFPSGNLAGGIAELDGFVFVLQKDGKIYNSNLHDVTTWTSTDFLTALRSVDTSEWICKHKDHLCVIGSKSIEFFYNAGNPAGSPLRRREDVFYNLGIAFTDVGGGYNNANAVDSNDDYVAFLGADHAQANAQVDSTGVYLIENFAVRKISTPEIDQFFSYYSGTGMKIRLFTREGKTYVLAEIANTTNGTWIYDISAGMWYIWTNADADGTGATADMDLAATFDNWYITTACEIYQSDYVSSDGDNAGTPVDFPFEIVTTNIDFGYFGDKFIRTLALNGDNVNADISVQYSDDNGATWSTARTINANDWNVLHRLGTTKKRKFKFSYTGPEMIRLRDCYSDISPGANSRKNGNG